MNEPPYEMMLEELERHRDALQLQYDKLSEVAEDARRACVPVQQQLEKIKDAVSSLSQARDWCRKQ